MLHCLIQFMNLSFLKFFQLHPNPLFHLQLIQIHLNIIQIHHHTIQYILFICHLLIQILITMGIILIIQILLTPFIMILIPSIMIQVCCTIQNLPKLLKTLWLRYLAMLRDHPSTSLMFIKRRLEMVNNISQFLKIAQKVAFNIASEASYACIFLIKSH